MITEEGKKLVNIDHEGAYVPYDSLTLELEATKTVLKYSYHGKEVSIGTVAPLSMKEGDSVTLTNMGGRLPVQHHLE